MEFIDPKGEPTDVSLNSNMIKIPSGYLYLYPETCATPNIGQRRFLLQWEVVNAEIEMHCC